MAALVAQHEDPASPAAVAAVERLTGALAARMGNAFELLKDATLPVMSYFSGARFSHFIASVMLPQAVAVGVMLVWLVGPTGTRGVQLGPVMRSVMAAMAGIAGRPRAVRLALISALAPA